MPSIGKKLREEFLQPSSNYLPQSVNLRYIQERNQNPKANSDTRSSLLHTGIYGELTPQDSSENEAASTDSLYTKPPNYLRSKAQNVLRRTRRAPFKVSRCTSPKGSKTYKKLRLLQKQLSNGIAIQASLDKSSSFLNRFCYNDNCRKRNYKYNPDHANTQNIFEDISLMKGVKPDHSGISRTKEEYIYFRDYVSRQIKEQKRNKSFVEIDAKTLQDILTENILLKKRILRSNNFTASRKQLVGVESKNSCMKLKNNIEKSSTCDNSRSLDLSLDSNIIIYDEE